MDTLKATAVSFYTSHELSVAKAKLQKTAEKVGIDGLHCLKKRAGPNKAKAEADDIITILQVTDEQKLLNCLPSYVAANTDRLPTTPVESVDVVILAKKLHLLDQRLNDKCGQLDISKLLESCHPTPQLASGSSAAADQYSSDKFEEFETRLAQLEASHLTSQLPFKPLVTISEHALLKTQSSHPESQLGTSADSLANGETTVDLSTVNQANDTLHPVQPTYADHFATKTADAKEKWFRVVRQRPKKVVGNAGSADLKPASTVSARKAVFHVDNLDCVDDVVKYLNRNDISALTCFVKSRMRANCIAMRVCVYASDTQKFLDANLWQSSVIVRPWKFKGKNKKST